MHQTGEDDAYPVQIHLSPARALNTNLRIIKPDSSLTIRCIILCGKIQYLNVISQSLKSMSTPLPELHIIFLRSGRVLRQSRRDTSGNPF
jgi:hypothetical protein